MNTTIECRTVQDPKTSPDWRAVIRDMHLKQAKAWEESAKHWRGVAHRALDKDEVDLAQHALMTATMSEAWAEEETRYAQEMETKMAARY